MTNSVMLPLTVEQVREPAALADSETSQALTSAVTISSATSSEECSVAAVQAGPQETDL